jgi:hypothetical protein
MLKVVGQPAGKWCINIRNEEYTEVVPGVRCGSSSIDTSFQQWMQRDWPKKGGFEKTAKKLGFTEEYVLQKATILFQEHKKMFPSVPGGGFKDIYIYPKNNKGTGVGVPLGR